MKILMVCLGNICRSPLAHGIMENIIKERNLPWSVDSCGTSNWHSGELPDKRSVEVAAAHGIDITTQRARQLKPSDLDEFDLILTMDASNYQNVMALATSDAQKEKIHLILNFVYQEENRAVPDPYFEGGFENVYQMLHNACNRIADRYQTATSAK